MIIQQLDRGLLANKQNKGVPKAHYFIHRSSLCSNALNLLRPASCRLLRCRGGKISYQIGGTTMGMGKEAVAATLVTVAVVIGKAMAVMIVKAD
jgi:hypothetical protein